MVPKHDIKFTFKSSSPDAVTKYKFSEFVLILKTIICILMFIYAEKATKFCEISNLNLTTVHAVKSKVVISHNFVAFSEYMNFTYKLISTSSFDRSATFQ